MEKPEFYNGAEVVFQKAEVCLALFATVGACALANPKDAMAHGGKLYGQPEQAEPISDNLLPAIGNTALSTDLPPDFTPDNSSALRAPAAKPYIEEAETRPVTMQDVNRFLPVARGETPNSPCNTTGYTFRFLPARDNDNDPGNDMRTPTSESDGSLVDAMGRSNGNCRIDLLNQTTPGPRGENRVCTTIVHETKHADTSLGPWGYISADPAPGNIRHDRANGLLMSVGGSNQYLPCIRETIDKTPQSIISLAEEATERVPVLAKAFKTNSAIECIRYYKPKTRRLCYSSPMDSYSTTAARNGTIIRVLSRYTIDGNPQIKHRKMPTRKLRKYLARFY